MIIRKDQLDALSAIAQQRSERRILGHVRRHYSEKLSAVGEPVMLQLIRRSALRVSSYGIVSERDWARFFGLMLVFGLRFDEDVKLPWAKRILTDPALTPAERMDRLWATAMHFLRHRSRNTATPNEVRRG